MEKTIRSVAQINQDIMTISRSINESKGQVWPLFRELYINYGLEACLKTKSFANENTCNKCRNILKNAAQYGVQVSEASGMSAVQAGITAEKERRGEKLGNRAKKDGKTVTDTKGGATPSIPPETTLSAGEVYSQVNTLDKAQLALLVQMIRSNDKLAEKFGLPAIQLVKKAA